MLLTSPDMNRMRIDMTRTGFGLLLALLVVGCDVKPPPLPVTEVMDTFKIHCMDTPTMWISSSNYDNDTLFRLYSAEFSRKDPSIQDGHYIIYYDKSFTSRVYEFDVKNGWKNGHHVYWYRNGQKQFEGFIDNQVDTGFYTQWDRNGKQVSKKYYKNDSTTVTVYKYYASGALKAEAVYMEHQTIEERTFHENGNRESETFFGEYEPSSNGRLLSVFWDSLGNYSKACQYQYELWVPDRQFPGDFKDSVVVKYLDVIVNIH